MSKEQWMPVKGYKKYYAVSNLGRIKSLSRMVKRGKDLYLKPELILKPGKNENGYFIVILSVNGIKKTAKVHRLVAMAFIQNPNKYPQVQHLDNNRLNNVVKNLRWGTPSENMTHCSNSGRLKIPHYFGDKNVNAKLNNKKVISIRKSKLSVKKLSKKYGVSIYTIHSVIKRNTWANI